MRRLLPIALIVMAGSLVGGLAFSQPEDGALCPDAVSMVEMESCMAAELELSEQRMMDAYSLALARARIAKAQLRGPVQGNDPAEMLEDAQAKWRAYRDAQCASVADRSGGSMRALEAISCKIELTEERTGALTDMATTPPGEETDIVEAP